LATGIVGDSLGHCHIRS